MLKSALVLCVLLLVSSDNLYFDSLHLSTRLWGWYPISSSVSASALYNTTPPSSPLRHISNPSRPNSWLACFYFPLSAPFFVFPFCCPPSHEKRGEHRARPVTVVPISQTKLADPVWYCQMAWKIKNPIKVAVQRSAPLHIKSAPLAILHKLYPLTAHFA